MKTKFDIGDRVWSTSTSCYGTVKEIYIESDDPNEIFYYVNNVSDFDNPESVFPFYEDDLKPGERKDKFRTKYHIGDLVYSKYYDLVGFVKKITVTELMDFVNSVSITYTLGDLSNEIDSQEIIEVPECDVISFDEYLFKRDRYYRLENKAMEGLKAIQDYCNASDICEVCQFYQNQDCVFKRNKRYIGGLRFKRDKFRMNGNGREDDGYDD